MIDEFSSSRTPTAASVAALAVLTVLMAAAGRVAAQAPERGADGMPTLTVSGSGEAAADPDQAVVRLGVVAEAAEAAAAQNDVNEIMARILDAVAATGVPESSVQTEDLSLSPVYSDYRPRPDQAEPEPPRITGYRASSVVSVEVDELSAIGGVVDAGIEAGANQLQGIEFRLRDDTAATARALGDAVRDARARAEAIAGAMGLDLEGVHEVVAGDTYQRPPIPFGGARFDMAEVAATPVRPGQVDLSATVTVTYYISGGE